MTASQIVGVLRSSASIRTIANVVKVEASAFDVLVDHTDIGAGWATETGAQAETGTPQVDRISIPLHELAALPKASQRLLDDFGVRRRGLAGAADRRQVQPGRGARPSSPATASTSRRASSATRRSTTTSSPGARSATCRPARPATSPSTDPADAIVDLVYSLGARYRANGTFVMNSKTAGAVRKMKDADGRFLWSDSLAAGEPARLMGYPVLIAEDMPDIAAGAYRGRLRRLPRRLHRGGAAGPAHPARPVLGQAARAVLRDQAHRRRRQRLRGDQAPEICDGLRPGNRSDGDAIGPLRVGRAGHTPVLSSCCSSLRSGGAGVCFRVSARPRGGARTEELIR